ncbi:MAG TPA: GGDEF domain-containing protein [Pseudonocardiaceae bacterium]
MHAAALLTVALTAGHYSVGRSDLATFGVLTALALGHLELTRGVERMRELANEGEPYVVWLSIWTFAGLLTLPPALVATLVVITYAHSWLRVGRHILLHRWTFSATMVVLSSAAGGVILMLTSHSGGQAGLPVGWVGLALVVATAIVRWAVNSALVLLAVRAMDPTVTWRRAIGMVFGADDLEEFASLSLGALVAFLLTAAAPWLLVLALPMLLLHRGLQLRKLQSAARSDAVTATLVAPVWRELAEKQLERAGRLGVGAGYLTVRVDGHDELAERAGPEAASRALRAVADVLRSVVRERDLVGRLPGAEFVVLLAEVGTVAELRTVAVRVRDVVGQQEPDGLTVSIGGALFPAHAESLEDLMRQADGALWLARAYRRGQIRIVDAGPDLPVRDTGPAAPAWPSRSSPPTARPRAGS